MVGHIPQTNVEENVDAEDTTEAVRKFKALHPHVLIELIDDVIVVGICGGCERPIMESEEDTSVYTDDDVYFCKECKPKNESRY